MITIVITLISIFCIGVFLQRVNLEYNANGRLLTYSL